MKKFDLIELEFAVAIARTDVIRSAGKLVGRLARRDDGSVYLSATEPRADYADTTLAEYLEEDFLAPYFSLRLLRDIRFFTTMTPGSKGQRK